MQEYDISFKGGQHGKWCADETDTVKCNRNAQGAWEKWKVVDLGNDKYAFKGGKNGKWCADEGPHGVKCNRNHIKSWETFTIERHGDRIALKGGKDGKYCADEGNRIVCNRPHVEAWEKFEPVGFDFPCHCPSN